MDWGRSPGSVCGGVYLVEIQHQYIIKERGDLSCRASKAYYRRVATLKAASRFYNPDADNRQVTTDCRPTFLFFTQKTRTCYSTAEAASRPQWDSLRYIKPIWMLKSTFGHSANLSDWVLSSDRCQITDDLLLILGLNASCADVDGGLKLLLC